MRQSIKYCIDTLCQNYIEGWAVSPAGRCTIEVVVDGRPVGKAVTGLPRSDVAAALPQIPGAGEAGFIYAFTEHDLSQSKGDAAVWLRIIADGNTLETEHIEVPAPGQIEAPSRLPRSCFPPTVTDAIVRRSPNLATGDLTSEDGTLAAVEVLEYLVRRGPRPLPGVHRYLGFLRAVYGAAIFAARYFPKANRRPTGEKDSTGVLTNPVEISAIAQHLYVLSDAGVSGAVLEFGCYKGFSTTVLSTACHCLGRDLHVFDSFKGLPSTTSSYYRPGEFAGDLEEVKRNIAEFGRPDVVKIHPGFFSESVPQWRAQPVMCLWMDVDLEQSAIDALRIFPNVDSRSALFSHECQPSSFAGNQPAPRRGPDDVVGPIVDAFSAAGRQSVGIFICGNTGAFWDAQTGIPVLPAGPFQRLINLALE
jgi:O-methyltransferase